jgi:hypothetical protein
MVVCCHWSKASQYLLGFNTARCAKIAKPETLVETLHVTSLQGLTKAVLCWILDSRGGFQPGK